MRSESCYVSYMDLAGAEARWCGGAAIDEDWALVHYGEIESVAFVRSRYYSGMEAKGLMIITFGPSFYGYGVWYVRHSGWSM